MYICHSPFAFFAMKTMRAFLLLATIIPNVSSTDYIYTKGSPSKGCVGMGVTAVLTAENCEDANKFFGLLADVKEKNIDKSPIGCYYFEDNNELHFNENQNGKLADDSMPICKVEGIAD